MNEIEKSIVENLLGTNRLHGPVPAGLRYDPMTAGTYSIRDFPRTHHPMYTEIYSKYSNSDDKPVKTIGGLTIYFKLLYPMYSIRYKKESVFDSLTGRKGPYRYNSTVNKYEFIISVYPGCILSASDQILLMLTTTNMSNVNEYEFGIRDSPENYKLWLSNELISNELYKIFHKFLKVVYISIFEKYGAEVAYLPSRKIESELFPERELARETEMNEFRTAEKFLTHLDDLKLETQIN